MEAGPPRRVNCARVDAVLVEIEILRRRVWRCVVKNWDWDWDWYWDSVIWTDLSVAAVLGLEKRWASIYMEVGRCGGGGLIQN